MSKGKIRFLECVLLLIPLALSCQQEERHEKANPVEFTATTRLSILTKTAYAGGSVADGQKERIDWKQGDRVSIASPEASGLKKADYVISANGTPDGVYSTSTLQNTSSSANGLQWGSGAHHFYGVYPATSTISNNVITATLPKVQANAGAADAKKAKNPAVDSTYIYPNMEYAWMYSGQYAANSKSKVSLFFAPMVTAFQISVMGLDNEEITLSQCKLISENCALQGSWKATVSVSGKVERSSLGNMQAAYSEIPARSASNSELVFTLPADTKISNAKKVTLTLFALPEGASANKDYLDGLKVQFVSSDFTRSLDLKYSATHNDYPGQWVQFPAGRKINIDGLTLPRQPLGWTFTVSGADWEDEELSDVVVSPATMTEFETEDGILNIVKPTYSFSISESYSSVNYRSGSRTFKIKSYSTDPISKNTQDIYWTAAFSTDNGQTWSSTPPNWLTCASSGSGSVSGSDYMINYRRNPDISQKTWEGATTVLAANPGSAIDLSLQDIYGNPWAQTTANSYVVSAPGWYKIPCVYGNSILAAADNPDAYSGFYGHKGLVSSPWIKDNGIILKDAVLCWQDHDELITSSGANALFYSGDYIYFYVSPEHIFQGNALLAVLADDDGDGVGETIAWSWHIWVTEGESYRDNLKTQDVYSHPTSWRSAQYPNRMMNVNLGWCDKEIFISTTRSAMIRFTQEESDETRTYKLTQGGRTITSYGSTVNFQHGRKDPIPPLNGVQEAQAPKDLFPEDDTNQYRFQTRMEPADNLSESIQHPYVLFASASSADEAGYGDWCKIVYLNLWDKGLTYKNQDRKVTKTIYDPCPPGFHVPNYYAFTGFYKNEFNYAEISDKGIWFYCDPDGIGSSPGVARIFFPLCGDQYVEGGGSHIIRYIGTEGASWTAPKYSVSGNQGAIFIYRRNDGRLTNNGSQVAYPVRPCLEEYCF